MAKKSTSKKAARKKATPRKKAATKKAATKKPATKSAPKTAKKKVVKKAAASKATKKPVSKKGAAKKAPAKKAVSKKAPAKKLTAKKAPAKKPVGKKAPAKNVTVKKAPVKKAASKKAAQKAKPAASSTKKTSTKAEPAKNADAGKPARKGITIVNKKTTRKKAPKVATKMPTFGTGLLGPGVKRRKPLIPSGPKAPPVIDDPQDGGGSGKKVKSPFTKRQLDKYRAILIRKREELFGDVATMEGEALQAESGGLSHTPQHIAEIGSEAYDQSLSLDLAAADRKLIKEIDDAIKRIDAGTYGVCELTRTPISTDRLEELPWARYSIEAARRMEQRHHWK